MSMPLRLGRCRGRVTWGGVTPRMAGCFCPAARSATSAANCAAAPGWLNLRVRPSALPPAVSRQPGMAFSSSCTLSGLSFPPGLPGRRLDVRRPAVPRVVAGFVLALISSLLAQTSGASMAPEPSIARSLTSCRWTSHCHDLTHYGPGRHRRLLWTSGASMAPEDQFEPGGSEDSETVLSMTGLWKADTMDVKRGVATSCDLVALPGKCAVSRYGIPTLKSLKPDTSRRASARKGQRRELLNPGSAGSVIRDREIGGVSRIFLPLRAPETPRGASL